MSCPSDMLDVLAWQQDHCLQVWMHGNCIVICSGYHLTKISPQNPEMLFTSPQALLSLDLPYERGVSSKQEAFLFPKQRA